MANGCYRFAVYSPPGPGKWVLSACSYPQQCICEWLPQFAVYQLLILANGCYRLALISSHAFKIAAINLRFTPYLVLANGCYQCTCTCISVLANGCQQFVAYSIPCLSKWVISICNCPQPSIAVYSLPCLSKWCYHFTVFRSTVLVNGFYQFAVNLLPCHSKGVLSNRSPAQQCMANGCYQFPMSQLPYFSKWVLSICIYPQQVFRNCCYQFTVSSLPSLSKWVLPIYMHMHQCIGKWLLVICGLFAALSQQKGAFSCNFINLQLSTTMFCKWLLPICSVLVTLSQQIDAMNLQLICRRIISNWGYPLAHSMPGTQMHAINLQPILDLGNSKWLLSFCSLSAASCWQLGATNLHCIRSLCQQTGVLNLQLIRYLVPTNGGL